MSTLDDFFAKKDRKKKGAKSGDSKNEKIDAQKKEKIVDITDNFKYINENDDDWLDFEENRDKDYSGLKIQALNLKDKEQVLQEQRLAELNDESKDGNAWSSKAPNQGTEEIEKEESKDEKDEKETKKESDQPEQPKKYIPPSLRSNISEAPKKVVKNKAPEISNNSEFPTLG